MSRWSVYYCSMMLFFLHGCGKKPLLQYDKIAHKKVPVLCQFEAEVEGVECALCAQDAKEVFTSIDGASMVDFVMSGTSYEQGHIHFCYDIRKNNIDLQKIDQAIALEGFVLHSLKGAFNLQLIQKNGQYFVAYNDDLQLPLLIPSTAENLEKIINLSSKEAQFISGKIVRQSGAEFLFVPDQPLMKDSRA